MTHSLNVLSGAKTHDLLNWQEMAAFTWVEPNITFLVKNFRAEARRGVGYCRRRLTMQSLLSVLLLFFLLFQAVGYLFIFTAQQYNIRTEIQQQIKAGVPVTDLVLFKILPTSSKKTHSIYQWIHESELRYDGNLYDVVCQEVHGDTTWYYCISDEKETQLFANLDKLVKRDMSQNTEWQQRVGKLLQLLGPWFLSPPKSLPLFESTEETAANDYCFRLKNWTNVPPPPPPKA